MAEPKKRGRPPKPKEIMVDDPTGEVISDFETKVVEKQITKKKTMPGDIVNASTAKSEEVSQTLANCLRWYRMPKVQSVEELQERIEFFFVTCFENGEIPTWEKLCLSTGFTRSALWEWATGVSVSSLGAPAGDLVKKAKDFLATFESEMVTNGKINPVVYIFRAKNYFGMKDQQEYVLTPNQPLGEAADPATMAQKYRAALPADPSDYDIG